MCEEKKKRKPGTETPTDKYIQKRRRAREFRSRETDEHSRLIIQVRRRKIETEKKKSMPMRGTTKEGMRRELLLYSLWNRGQRWGADRETCERGGGRVRRREANVNNNTTTTTTRRQKREREREETGRNVGSGQGWVTARVQRGPG